MRLKWLFVAISITSFLWLLSTAVMAQGETPPPYTGMKNPFPWSDTSVQEAGKSVYQQSCLGCHGIEGANLSNADFSLPAFPQSLENSPDFYFWVLSEGRLDRGMPPYKSSLLEEQRWQVLTYLWSLGVAVPPEETPPITQPPVEGADLRLTAPKQAQSGQALALTVALTDDEDKPVANVPVTFLSREDFFTSGLMKLGEALTNDQGMAVFEYIPQQTGDTEIVARYGTTESTATVTLTGDSLFYQTEVGLRLPSVGKPVFIGPESALELGEMGQAPTSAFYLPGGTLSWLLLVAVTIMLIWFTYFRVIYQVFRIPIVSEIRDTDTRRVPLVLLAFVTIVGILLVLMLLTGPYSHFHLLP